ncbi:MAG: DinB family protein [Terracidiphilus sp.]
MTIAKELLAEFETQAPVTRRFLERVPEEKLTWRPHERSMTAGQLALHIALAPGRLLPFVQNNPAKAPEFGNYPQPASREEILKAFDESAATVRGMLPTFDDAAMKETWHMMAGDRAAFSQPRGEFLRDIMFSHLYQHRGQLSVYLRMLNVAVPASWGPSADEAPAFMQKAQAAEIAA